MESEESSRAEVPLLKKLCRSLDRQRQKNHQAAMEWQNFGRFTATVLQKEVENFERKLRVLQEKMDGLVQENRELREMCFYLDKSREVSESRGKSSRGKLQDSNAKCRAPVHSMCAVEMNKDEGPTLQYTGITSENTLRDTRGKRFNILGMNPQTAVTVLQKRVEKLESEKLELIKSLSAAHLLATQHSQSVGPLAKTALLPPSSVEKAVLPPEFQSLLESCSKDEDHTHLKAPTSSPGLNVSADMIMQAVTLLDMCRRLDAMEVNGFSDPLEGAEVATLRVLMSISWQRLQEASKKQ